MGRRIGAVVAGLFGSVVVIMAVQAVNGWLYPPPPGTDLSDPDALAALMAQMPVGALLMVELSYAAGSFAGGAVVRRVSADRAAVLAAVVGGLLTLAGFANLAAIPHPLWFGVLSTVTYVPCALLGAAAAARLRAG